MDINNDTYYQIRGEDLDENTIWVALVITVNEFDHGVHQATITHSITEGEHVRFATAHPIVVRTEDLSELPEGLGICGVHH